MLQITVISSILVFSLIIIFLVILITIAEKKLLPQGGAKILINGDDKKSPTVKPGSSLLSSLAEHSVFIPSACGGGGTCSQCKCQVLSGGGDILTSLDGISWTSRTSGTTERLHAVTYKE